VSDQGKPAAAAPDSELLRRLLDSSPDGMVLVDAQDGEGRVVYVNTGFQLLTGYAADELIGVNLRILQGTDREQEGRHRLREAQKRGESCRVLLRNYRKDGTMFWNEISIEPLLGADGKISHYAGYHRNAGDRLRSDPRLARDAAGAAANGLHPPSTIAARDDRLTGLYTLPYLEELLKRDWASAQRERRSVAIFSIDIDSLDLYNATFGRAGGDSTIRRVAHCVSGCLRRATDVTARADGGRLVAYAPGLGIEQAMRVGKLMAERVRDLRIHHPRSSVLRYISISVGVAAAVPDAESSAALLQKAQMQLQFAKSAGRNQAA
jgi:two-component system cell cycle response regulator